MIKVYSIAALLLVLVPSSVLAQRAGDAALGAVAGAVVLGPVGAVAGAFVGYTAGPSISRSWGLERSRSSRHRRQASRDSVRGARAEAAGTAASPAGPAERSGRATSYPVPNPPRSASKRPPVQTLDRAHAPPDSALPPSCTGTTAARGSRTNVTVPAASAATLAETLPSSVRSIDFGRAPITM
jgi:hypothetical protein